MLSEENYVIRGEGILVSVDLIVRGTIPGSYACMVFLGIPLTGLKVTFRIAHWLGDFLRSIR